jgi:hypothetical protein
MSGGTPDSERRDFESEIELYRATLSVSPPDRCVSINSPHAITMISDDT